MIDCENDVERFVSHVYSLISLNKMRIFGVLNIDPLNTPLTPP